jgi:hypothetical protein
MRSEQQRRLTIGRCQVVTYQQEVLSTKLEGFGRVRILVLIHKGTKFKHKHFQTKVLIRVLKFS